MCCVKKHPPPTHIHTHTHTHTHTQTQKLKQTHKHPFEVCLRLHQKSRCTHKKCKTSKKIYEQTHPKDIQLFCSQLLLYPSLHTHAHTHTHTHAALYPL